MSEKYKNSLKLMPGRIGGLITSIAEAAPQASATKLGNPARLKLVDDSYTKREAQADDHKPKLELVSPYMRPEDMDPAIVSMLEEGRHFDVGKPMPGGRVEDL